jgi:transposase
MTEAYDGRQVVGMDLHRRRSVLVRMTGDGRKLETVRTGNSPAALRAVLARAGKNPRVVVEATYGWYWAADVLQAAGAELHLAHPLGVKAFSCRRVKNDERDCQDLAGLLRLGRLPEARVRPAAGPRTAGADQVPDQAGAAAVLGQGPGARGAGRARHAGALPGAVRRLRVGVAGGLKLPQPYAGKVASLRQLIGWLSGEISMPGEVIADLLGAYPPYLAVLRLPGIGPVLAAVAIAEIGDVSRFPGPGHLCSWAGLTPRHRESASRSPAGTSPGRARRSCGRRWWRRSSTSPPLARPASSRTASPPAAARKQGTSPGPRRPASCSPASACAMRDGEVRSLAAPGRTAEAG